jgi:leader peptidase (prepilin peptidase)/N-methyltransferase
VALAVLDAENLWLPDWLTLPGIALGFIEILLRVELNSDIVLKFYGAMALRQRMFYHIAFHWLLGILAAAGLILLIRWLYWLVRRREGLGLGDAKLMALLAAWLGLPMALLSLFFAVVFGSLVAVVLLALPKVRFTSDSDNTPWALNKLPLGTFLCIGGIVSSLWGQSILNAYLRWAGF